MNDERRVVIRRRRSRQAPDLAHASWKIALADFMTALMALFLVLWLFSGASGDQIKGVAQYFRTPLLVALTGGDRSSTSVSSIPGGGSDPTSSEGEVRKMILGSPIEQAASIRGLLQLQRRIQTIINSSPALAQVRNQVILDLSPEGLRIQIVDSEQRPMFELGGDEPAPYLRELLREMAPVLNGLPTWISISGHTDSLPYASGEKGYSNWELSADRANACRRELVAAGLDTSKLLRVSGMGERLPMPGTDARDPINRRITLVVHSRASAERVLGSLEQGAEASLALGASK